MSGGLQIKYPDGEFRDVAPVPGAIVINAADLLQHWTNEVITSTHHRVVAPTNPSKSVDGKFGERYSIAVSSSLRKMYCGI
jgi:isopenicillin N synthase-like dioxygenase